MAEEDREESARNKSKFSIFGIFGILIFACGAIISGFIIKQQPQVLGLSAQSEVTSLISQIGKIIVLPSNEIPTATTITDLTKLKGQPFFKNAKKNDKLLVYTNTKWAVLYRPSKNKIIEVGTFDINQSATISPTTIPSPSPTPSPTPTITPTTSPSPTPTVTPTTSPAISPKP